MLKKIGFGAFWGLVTWWIGLLLAILFGALAFPFPPVGWAIGIGIWVWMGCKTYEMLEGRKGSESLATTPSK